MAESEKVNASTHPDSATESNQPTRTSDDVAASAPIPVHDPEPDHPPPSEHPNHHQPTEYFQPSDIQRPTPIQNGDSCSMPPPTPGPGMVAPSPKPPPQYLQYPQPDYWQPGMPHPSGYNTVAPLHALQRSPSPVDCPLCGAREITRTEAKSGNTTHGWAFVLCCCLCLGCIPYLVSSMKDVEHHCGKCGAMLAVWHNSGRVEVQQNTRPAPPQRKDNF